MAVSTAGARAELRGTGWVTRLRIAALVLVNVLLAIGAAVALTWLAGRPGLRQRFDLTAAGENTLDESTRAVLDELPAGEPIRIDVFFRPLDRPLTQIGARAQARMFDLLLLARDYRADRIVLTAYDTGGAATGGSKVEARMRELGLRGLENGGVVAVSRGGRKELVRLVGDIAEIDLGNPDERPGQYVPPRLVRFRGEEGLLVAVLKVTQGESPQAYFSWGHGERDLYGDEPFELGRLERALRDDGFVVARWVPDEDGPVPDDCAVLAIVGPEEPFRPAELDWVREYVDSGGSLIAVPGHTLEQGVGSVTELLAGYGIRVVKGIICRPEVAPGGSLVFGVPECSALSVRAANMARSHPITEPLRRGDRRVLVNLTRSFERGRKPAGGVLLDILSANESTWRDLPDDDGTYRWNPDPGLEQTGPFSIAMTSCFPPPKSDPSNPVGPMRERPEARVLALGTFMLFINETLDWNRDFLLNAFNWAASREYRVNISPRDPDLRRLEIGSGRALAAMNALAVIGLPLLCLLMGLGTAWRRKR